MRIIINRESIESQYAKKHTNFIHGKSEVKDHTKEFNPQN